MTVFLRKIKNLPKRLALVGNELKYIAEGFIHSFLETILIRKCIRNTQLEFTSTRLGVAVINAGRSWRISDVELYLAHLLSTNGTIVYVLFDDGVLEHWDGAQFHKLRYYSPYRARWFIKLRHSLQKRFVWWAYRNQRMHLINYSRIIKNYPPEKILLKEDVAYSKSSTKRFFETGEINISGEHKAYFEKSLINCRISRSIARYVIDYIRPDLYVTSHGIYSLWGPAYSEIREAGIPIVVWQVAGTAIQRIRLVDRQDQILSNTGDWKKFDVAPVTEHVLEEGRSLLNDRVKHRAQDTMEYFGGKAKQTGHCFRKDNEIGTSFAMFPNVVWDGDVPERNILFENVVEWCEFTINVFRNTNHRLYVRFHPSEVTRLKGSVKLQDILGERIPDIMDIPNLTLIASGENVDTYDFAKNCVDVGLIYDGTLCIELTHLGIPVIACTDGNFTPETVVFKPKTKTEYSEWLNNPSIVIQEFESKGAKRISAARKYAYWLFKESLFEFKPLEKPYPSKINYKLVGLNDPISSDEREILRRLLQPLDVANNSLNSP